MSTEPRPHLNQDGNEKFVAIPTSGLPATQPTSYPNFDFLKNLPFEYLSGQALLAHPDAGLYHKIYWKTIDAEGEEEDPQVIAAEEGFESGTYLWARKPLADGGDILYIFGQGSGSVTAFTDLTDTFADYTDREGQVLLVNDEANGVDSVETVALPALGEDEVWVGDGEGGVTTMAIDDIGGEPLTPVDGILDWDTNVYKPYTSKQSSLLHFYTGTTNPDGTTRLNVDGVLAATQLISKGVEEILFYNEIEPGTSEMLSRNWLLKSAEGDYNYGFDFYRFVENDEVVDEEIYGSYIGYNNTNDNVIAATIIGNRNVNGGIGDEPGEVMGSILLGSENMVANKSHYDIAIGWGIGNYSDGTYNSIAIGHFPSGIWKFPEESKNVLIGDFKDSTAGLSSKQVCLIGGGYKNIVAEKYGFNIYSAFIDNTEKTITLPSPHKFKAGTSVIVYRVGAGGVSVPQWVLDNGIMIFDVIDEHTLYYPEIDGAGDMWFSIRGTEDIENSSGLGYNAFPTKPNQVMLGDANVTEVYSAGLYKGAGIQLNDLQTAPSSASDTGTKGEVRIAAGAIYVCTDTDTWVKATLATW